MKSDDASTASAKCATERGAGISSLNSVLGPSARPA